MQGMSEAPFMTGSFPRAIVHLDCDAFFTSVEQALVPALKGKPVVTGKERGIIACPSYEAKALGITRGMPLAEARKRSPGLIVLPSDYETYGLYSRRMFNIMRRFTPEVEEYSIDEGFADLTGLRRLYHTSYEAVAQAMKAEVQRELGITVSVGLAPSKGLAKLCSKFRKPDGFTTVEGRLIHEFLKGIPLGKVWGFGHNTVSLLEKHGLRTAYDFAVRTEMWAGKLLGKVGRDIWNELRGVAIHKVEVGKPKPQASVVKSKTFTPSSRDREFIYAQLVRNVEQAFAKVRRHRLRPRVIGVVLRRQDFLHDGLEARLDRPTSATLEVLPLVQGLFGQIYRAGVDYRASLIWLGGLEDDGSEQMGLFDDRPRIEAFRRVSEAMDAVNERYGRYTVRTGAGLFLSGRPVTPRESAPERQAEVLPGETRRHRLGIPRLTLAGV